MGSGEWEVGSGKWGVGSQTSVFCVLDNWPLPTPHSYRVGSGNEEWANFKVFTDHFAHFLFSTSHFKSSYRVGSGNSEWVNCTSGK